MAALQQFASRQQTWNCVHIFELKDSQFGRMALHCWWLAAVPILHASLHKRYFEYLQYENSFCSCEIKICFHLKKQTTVYCTTYTHNFTFDIWNLFVFNCHVCVLMICVKIFAMFVRKCIFSQQIVTILLCSDFFSFGGDYSMLKVPLYKSNLLWICISWVAIYIWSMTTTGCNGHTRCITCAWGDMFSLMPSKYNPRKV